ncbi:Retrovirus-related Pol polyprotein from transposon TNT 1-94 [Sesamum angolense]|uniref:Retrovirus-related Pol polyprotein from transposon TNT 1-94 n=1 Tax=Sesamum angolense TaxID=2727404 RepID=A0AAE1XAX4_9LAMI|nr:Retrovirus-related Pol polyprotein from transposon TNT 1-94 [Sesamum angolense]
MSREDSDVNLSSLRIFGCSAFALSHGDKLDPRSQKCIFIGYPDGVKGYRLWLRSQPGVKLMGYVDSNYANDRDSRRSTTSYVFTLCGACISWKYQLQNIVALSTTEAEYIAITEAFKEALWLEGPRSPLGCDDHQDLPPLDLVQEPLWLRLILAFVAVVDLALSGLDL